MPVCFNYQVLCVSEPLVTHETNLFGRHSFDLIASLSYEGSKDYCPHLPDRWFH